MVLHRIFIICFLITLPSALPSSATSFYIRPLSEFVNTAHHAVRGRITAVQSEYGINDLGQRTIYTYAMVEVSEVLKGTPPQNMLKIRKLGGTKDGVTLDIPSSPEFQEGMEGVFLMNAMNPDQSFDVTGLELGLFGIQNNNGKQILTGGLLGYSQHQHGSNAANADHEHFEENERTWTLDEFRNLLSKSSTPVVQNAPDSAPANSVKTTSTENHQKNADEIVISSTPIPTTDETSNRITSLAILSFAVAIFFTAARFFRRNRK